MTPTLKALQEIFTAQIQDLVAVKNGEEDDRPLLDIAREVAKPCLDKCSQCTCVLRAIGELPLARDHWKNVAELLVDFSRSAPPLLMEPIKAAMEGEIAAGMWESFMPGAKKKQQEQKKGDKKTDPEPGAFVRSFLKRNTTIRHKDFDMTNKQQSALEAVAQVIAEAASGNSTTFKNTKVVKEGEKIILPDGMSCKQAIDVLQKQAKEEETEIRVDIVIDAYPFEGARAFQTAMSEQFGWVNMVPTPGFFGSTPPAMIEIDVDVRKTESVIWGRVIIPAIDGFLQTQITVRDNRFLFQIGGIVKKKSMPLVEKLGALTKKHVKQNSIYKGKAVRFSFPNPEDIENFDITKSPKFMDTTATNPDDLIFSKDVDAQIRRAIFNPIEYTDTCRKLKIPLKRGTLLAGKFGVGKSMSAAVTAHLCVKNGWSFFYLEKPEQLPTAIRFARNYQPAVIFVEDVDKVTKGERTKALDDLLNAIDGVDTKGGEVMLIFTTNQLEVINPAVLRAGRLDDIVEVLPPDAAAVDRLIRLYARGLLAPNEKLSKVSSLLEGQIPATISDVCTRAQLAAVPRAIEGKIELREEDLLTAAQGKMQELEMVKGERPETYGNSPEKAARILATAIEKTPGQAAEIATAAAMVVANASAQAEEANGKKKAQARTS